MSLRSRPPRTYALPWHQHGSNGTAFCRPCRRDEGWLPDEPEPLDPPRPYFVEQLQRVEDAGPWRGPTLDAWLARISRWPVPWINGGSRVVW